MLNICDLPRKEKEEGNEYGVNLKCKGKLNDEMKSKPIEHI